MLRLAITRVTTEYSVWRAPMRAVDNSVFDGDRSENEDTVAVVLHGRFELQPLNSD